MSEVIDFKSGKKLNTQPTLDLTANTYEFHFFPEDGFEPEVLNVTGYLKFGPQFIAVTSGPDDTSQVVMACQTNCVKFVKRIDPENIVQGTLSL